MKIKNKIAGEWKLFSEGLPPEYPEKNIDLIVEIKDWQTAYFSWNCEERLWNEFSSDEYWNQNLTTAELAEQYDAYCVIQGPWEDKDVDL